MNVRLALILALLAVLPAQMAAAAGKRSDKAKVSFHMQTEATDNPKMIFPHVSNGRQRHYLRMPEFSTKDVLSFNPFPSDLGGGDYGMILKLKPTSAQRLAAITNANQGRWMVAQVNGRPMDGVLIDKPVTDGILVIWSGLTMADVDSFDKAFPRIGSEGKKKKN